MLVLPTPFSVACCLDARPPRFAPAPAARPAYRLAAPCSHARRGPPRRPPRRGHPLGTARSGARRPGARTASARPRLTHRRLIDFDAERVCLFGCTLASSLARYKVAKRGGGAGSSLLACLLAMLARRVLFGAGFVASAIALAGALETSVAFTSTGLTTASSAAQPSASASAAPVFVPDAASRVNLFVGTTNGGHVFPGEFLELG